MSFKDPAFSFGIEEEYMLVDRQTRGLAQSPPAALFAACEAALGKQVSREFLQCQIEVGTRICTTPKDATDQLRHMRRTIATIAAEYGLAPIAASTHPFSPWSEQQPTDRARYQAIAKDLAGLGNRLVICGMHVHCGIEDQELRIDLMNQIRYFLPHILALASSSPFHEGRDTGLSCYRLAAYHEIPRTGLPGRFSSWDEYAQTVDVLVKAGVIEDATKIWWDVRPSARFPTLEMRVTDVATRVEDSVAVAMLYVCLLRMLTRIRRSNHSWRQYPVFLIAENRWRAMRYGVQGTLFDFGRGELVPFRYLLEELLALIREDAEALGCVAEIEHLRGIVGHGTSADRQVATYNSAIKSGAEPEVALKGVVDQLIVETRGDQ
jgi:glutamate---cysteine ligase / carboxylate-amine ligase